MGYNVVVMDAKNKNHIGYCDGMYSKSVVNDIVKKYMLKYRKVKFEVVKVKEWSKDSKLISDIKDELK